MRFAVLFPVTALFALAACDSGAEAPAENEVAPVQAATAEATLPNEIPAAFQGRFGLSTEDCTSTAGDAKGLMEVSADQLKFYESTGKLDDITAATDARVEGAFSFTGEGMDWARKEVLDLREDGKVLVRREFGEGATHKPFAYTRCE